MDDVGVLVDWGKWAGVSPNVGQWKRVGRSREVKKFAGDLVAYLFYY